MWARAIEQARAGEVRQWWEHPLPWIDSRLPAAPSAWQRVAFPTDGDPDPGSKWFSENYVSTDHFREMVELWGYASSPSTTYVATRFLDWQPDTFTQLVGMAVEKVDAVARLELHASRDDRFADTLNARDGAPYRSRAAEKRDIAGQINTALGRLGDGWQEHVPALNQQPASPAITRKGW